VITRIDRKQKNQMRYHLEQILNIYKKLEEKIDDYVEKTEVEDYQNFWQELKVKNNENIRFVSRYMITKCNR